MSKNTKPAIVEEVVIEELDILTPLDPQYQPAPAPVVKKAKEVKEAKKAKEPKAKPEPKVIDISPLLAKLPDTFTPALLDKVFNLNDGGKTVRRHLRKHFAQALEHNHKDKWTFTKEQTAILTHLANLYAYDLKVLEPVTAEAK